MIEILQDSLSER